MKGLIKYFAELIRLLQAHPMGADRLILLLLIGLCYFLVYRLT